MYHVNLLCIIQTIDSPMLWGPSTKRKMFFYRRKKAQNKVLWFNALEVLVVHVSVSVALLSMPVIRYIDTIYNHSTAIIYWPIDAFRKVWELPVSLSNHEWQWIGTVRWWYSVVQKLVVYRVIFEQIHHNHFRQSSSYIKFLTISKTWSSSSIYMSNVQNLEFLAWLCLFFFYFYNNL